MSGFKGDYLGFTFGENEEGKPMHSSELGIVRTSDGSRFNENLLPTIQDKTVQVPGGDGTYYFGSYYTQRQISVPFAFDDLSEAQLRQLKKHFGDKKIHGLTFDEAPYKTYQAKVTGTAQIKHLVFNEGEGRERIYKGSGTIQFTCYQPYAVCTEKCLTDYNDYENKNEWKDASGLLETLDGYDTVLEGGYIKLYNPGDINAHFKLTIKFNDDDIISPGCFKIQDEKGLKVIGTLSWKGFGAKPIDENTKDSGVVFNTQTNLVEGIDGNGKKTGNLYNQYVAGAFFKIPPGEWKLQFTDTNGENFQPSEGQVEIEYNYYYI